MSRSSLLMLCVLLCVFLRGCFISTNEDLWKDGALDQIHADLVIEQPAGDGPLADSQRDGGDGPEADGPTDGSPFVDGKPDGEPDVLQDLLPAYEGKYPLGTACTAPSQCQSSHCVDQVCCESSCTGPCYSCAVTSKLGSCTPYPAGSDPDNECAQDPVASCDLDGTCDGQGGCRSYVQGTPCGTSCISGTHHGSKECDGAGLCVPGTTGTSCAPFACDPSAGSCYVKCQTAAECSPGYTCNPGGQCKL